MSEFSHSMHLFGISTADAVCALRRSGEVAAILGTNDRSVSIIGSWDLASALSEAQPRLVLEYSFAEDHGFLLRVWSAGERVAVFEINWFTFDLGEDFQDEVGEADASAAKTPEEFANILAELGMIPAESRAALSSACRQLVDQVDDWEQRSAAVRQIAETLHLFASAHVSGENLIHNPEGLKEQYPEFQLVSPDEG